MSTEQLLLNNEAWANEQLANNPAYFTDLARGQAPNHLYIGCSDSRVAASTMLGLQPGEVFVHRNIANLIGNTDLSALGVINFAVSHLQVDHIIICGHYFCGGIKAAMTTTDHGILSPYLREIRDVYRLHQEELNALPNEMDRYHRLVELNVQEQCINVAKTPEVQHAMSERGLRIYGWVFDISTGKIIDLQLDIEALMKQFMTIYKLE